MVRRLTIARAEVWEVRSGHFEFCRHNAGASKPTMACNAKSWHQSSERSETVVWLFLETFGHIWMKSAGKCCPDSKEVEPDNEWLFLRVFGRLGANKSGNPGWQNVNIMISAGYANAGTL